MEKIFGRSDVIEVLGITERPASTLLGKMEQEFVKTFTEMQ